MQFNARSGQFLGDERQSFSGDFRVHQHCIQSIADGGTPDFGVVDNLDRHLQVGGPVHVGMANPDAARDRRHGCVLSHEPDQTRATPGHQQIDVLVHLEQGVYQFAVRIIDELDGVLSHAGFRQGSAQ